jgi:hypothetical protein
MATNPSSADTISARIGALKDRVASLGAGSRPSPASVPGDAFVGVLLGQTILATDETFYDGVWVPVPHGWVGAEKNTAREIRRRVAAPQPDAERVERAAKAIFETEFPGFRWEETDARMRWFRCARAALAAAGPAAAAPAEAEPFGYAWVGKENRCDFFRARLHDDDPIRPMMARVGAKEIPLYAHPEPARVGGEAVAWMLDSDGHRTYWPTREVADFEARNLRNLGYRATVRALAVIEPGDEKGESHG